ncbi:hypothetical protein I317_03632 [Kwoniella heveanensis CBS 569]|uniref:Autophagy-related protein 14 n=1 Tax=Kwoniella heveanensis BCC8398 TaxID=1296120 RepID=A0A1B9GU10_9TREE|nr:hypothetical protein I316_03571 [Kwoniella heveanensis BCC8398]OCF42516.1 hypothetical protein I317_03632 [Kwoniella heveanensis CBS 569]
MTSNLPRCPVCQSQHPLFCASCLRESISFSEERLRDIQAQIDAITHQSRLLLQGGSGTGPLINPSRSPYPVPSRISAIAGPSRGVNAWRELRADVAERERRCTQLRRDISEREARIAESRATIAKSSVGSRRASLAALKSDPSPTTALQNAIKRCRSRQAEVSSNMIHARLVLVREAVALFGVRQRGKGEWEIASLLLPSPEAFRLYPSVSINAALSHTVHLLSLLTTYLSITLPFLPTPPPPLEKRHIGRPIMKANTPFVGTTKWRDRHVLWMSSTASLSSRLKSIPSSGPRSYTSSSASGASSSPFAAVTSLSSSRIFTAQPNISAVLEKSMNKHRQFLTSFALLAFSVAYLAYSQGVTSVGILDRGGEDSRVRDKDRDDSDDDEDLTINSSSNLNANGILRPRPPSRSQSRHSSTSTPTRSSAMISVTSILELIAALSVSSGLGRKTHEPGTNQVLQHLGFGLDVAKVVQSVLTAEESRWGTKKRKDDGSGEELSEGWDLLDAE